MRESKNSYTHIPIYSFTLSCETKPILIRTLNTEKNEISKLSKLILFATKMLVMKEYKIHKISASILRRSADENYEKYLKNIKNIQKKCQNI